MVIQLENGAPIGNPVLEANFKQLFPNTSFPLYLTPEIVEPFNFGMYEYSPLPNADRYEKVIEIAPVKDERGFWMQTWSIVKMTAKEKREADAIQAESIRNMRSFKLLQTDWTQLPDVRIDPAVWTSYRQELRDVTGQPGFPWDVQWPVVPS
jgi:hypothetical protein